MRPRSRAATLLAQAPQEQERGQQERGVERAKSPNLLLAVGTGEVASASYQGFKSAALQCEWSFREAQSALALKRETDNRGGDEIRQRLPDADFAEVCCKTLADLAPNCGPIRRLLTDLHVEFSRLIFSDFQALAPGQTTLCKVPHFEERETNKALLADLREQRDSLKAGFDDGRSRRQALEEEVKSLNKRLGVSERALDESKSKIVDILQIAEQARESYQRVQGHHDELSRELQHVCKQREEHDEASQLEISILRIRVTQLSNDLMDVAQRTGR